MKISLSDLNIILDDLGDLKSYQISQLVYYGYKQHYGTHIKYSESPIVDVIKIIEYFEEENIGIEYTEEILKLIEHSTSHKNELKSIFKTAKNIKDGEIYSDSFIEFKNFTTTLPRKLKSHQIKSAFHFYTLGNGANFSVPGSGKTSTVLSVYQKLKEERKCNLLFVIGPPSCFQPWKNEFKDTLGRTADALILSGGNRELRRSEYYKSQDNIFELYLTTFQTVMNDCEEIIKFLSQKGVDAFLIIDEAHYIKQLGGSWSSSILKISKYSKYKGILTGTPIPKSYKDVFNLFDFLWNEDSPLSHEDKIRIDLDEKKKNFDDVKLLLQNKIGSLFYRVRKEDLGLRPAIFHEPIVVKMNNSEQLIYDYVKATIYSLEVDNYFKNEDVLSNLWKGRMMRLRQAVSYPKLLMTAIDNH
mgnify:CR=1 FL=1